MHMLLSFSTTFAEMKPYAMFVFVQVTDNMYAINVGNGTEREKKKQNQYEAQHR